MAFVKISKFVKIVILEIVLGFAKIIRSIDAETRNISVIS